MNANRQNNRPPSNNHYHNRSNNYHQNKNFNGTPRRPLHSQNIRSHSRNRQNKQNTQNFPDNNLNNPLKHDLNTTNVYICQFPTNWTEEDLEPLVRPFGPIREIKIKTPHKTKEPFKGIAFVHYQNSKSAAAAIHGLNNHPPAGVGHNIVVKLANKSANAASGEDIFSNLRLLDLLVFNKIEVVLLFKTKLVLTNIPENWTKKYLVDKFAEFGRIWKIKFDGQKAVINFESQHDCLRALEAFSKYYSVDDIVCDIKNPNNRGSQYMKTLIKTLEAANLESKKESRMPSLNLIRERANNGFISEDDENSIKLKKMQNWDSIKKRPRINFDAYPLSALSKNLTKRSLKNLEYMRNVYVSAFPNCWGEGEVQGLFMKFGKIELINITTKKTKNPAENSGTAFVHFLNELSAIKAVAVMQKTIPLGCMEPLLVDFAKVQPDKCYQTLLKIKKIN